jgi:hypothetical protein
MILRLCQHGRSQRFDFVGTQGLRVLQGFGRYRADPGRRFLILSHDSTHFLKLSTSIQCAPNKQHQVFGVLAGGKLSTVSYATGHGAGRFS